MLLSQVLLVNFRGKILKFGLYLLEVGLILHCSLVQLLLKPLVVDSSVSKIIELSNLDI